MKVANEESTRRSTRVTKSITTKKSRKSVGAKRKDRLSHLPEGVISNILSRLPFKEAVRTCVLSQVWEHKWTSIYNMANDDGIDRITHLPEGVISNILSRLFAEEAVRTSVLSKDWEYKWISIYNIYINEYNYKKTTHKTSFVKFVEWILLLTENIKTFHLSCSKDYNSGGDLTTWITTLLRRNVENLEIGYCRQGMVLPCSLLNNSSLRKLKLTMSCTIKVPSTNYLANLKCLYLSEVEIINELSSTDTLIFTFPVLETFTLKFCEWMNVKTVEIYAPSLTSLVSETDDYVEILNYSIKIFGPKLVNFNSSGGSAENFIVDGPPVVKAVLRHQGLEEDLPWLRYLHCGLQFRSLLKEFSSLEELELTLSVAKAIANSKQGLALPRYDKLRKLFLDFGTDIEALLELLHSAPSLTILILDVCHYKDDDYNYNAVEPLPSCIVSHLEEVELRSYSRARGLAAFLLKNGVKLKKFHVNCHDYTPVEEIMEEVSTFPKASTCVSIVVE